MFEPYLRRKKLRPYGKQELTQFGAVMPKLSAERYISQFSQGETSERKHYCTRRKSGQTTKVVKKVIKKASDKTYANSLRDMEKFARVDGKKDIE